MPCPAYNVALAAAKLIRASTHLFLFYFLAIAVLTILQYERKSGPRVLQRPPYTLTCI